ncbi:unnamed protein product [Macrosiphum euphorbiae]|uniref:THAP-type domain-containing protein n=1 Tax=Macrosiphum euphorbiae TaxID=13131 RepID=A0AAV0Y9J1_9HEMI|nr:unnamed protein product [Macrosiphum euphorbiae]
MLCSVYGCSNLSEEGVKTGPEKIHFFTFPKREKSPKRFKKWSDFCKRKNFVPGKSAVICSKHFNENDLNQSDLLRQKLMPNSKVLVHLNAGVFPTIFSQQGSNQTLNHSQRSSRTKLQNMVNSVTAKTSTPKKNNNSCNNIETYISESESVDGSFDSASTSTIKSK